MRRKFTCVFSIAFLSQLVMLYRITVSAERVSVQQILSNPSEFDGQEISIQGIATKVSPRTSKRGNEYTTFTLTDESGEGVNVFTGGHPRVSEGQKVTVMGTYEKVKRVGKHVFYDEIGAKEIGQ
jgi:cytochrome c-type biogenesis protein CcmE